MRLQLRYELECGVCKQAAFGSGNPDAAVEIALFGHAAFAVCPCCRQEVVNHRDKNYRRRARRWALKLRGKPVSK